MLRLKDFTQYTDSPLHQKINAEQILMWKNVGDDSQEVNGSLQDSPWSPPNISDHCAFATNWENLHQI